MRVLKFVVVSCLLLGTTILTATPAGAKPLEREHYSGTDNFSFTDCGFLINGETNFSGLFMLKQGRRGDPTPYYFDNYEYQTTYVNPANGTWFVQTGNGLYKDLHVVNIEGTLYTFQAMEVGRPFEIRDMNGTLVVKDRGRLLSTFTVDTKGDTDLENDEFVEGSFQLLADSGSHPGFYLDFCELATQLLA